MQDFLRFALYKSVCIISAGIYSLIGGHVSFMIRVGYKRDLLGIDMIIVNI